MCSSRCSSLTRVYASTGDEGEREGCVRVLVAGLWVCTSLASDLLAFASLSRVALASDGPCSVSSRFFSPLVLLACVFHSVVAFLCLRAELILPTTSVVLVYSLYTPLALITPPPSIYLRLSLARARPGNRARRRHVRSLYPSSILPSSSVTCLQPPLFRLSVDPHHPSWNGLHVCERLCAFADMHSCPASPPSLPGWPTLGGGHRGGGRQSWMDLRWNAKRRLGEVGGGGRRRRWRDLARRTVAPVCSGGGVGS